MRVSALFYVSKITKTPTGYIEVTLNAVTRNTSKNPSEYASGNIDWAKYTPSGQITMNVSTETDAAKFFEDNLGKDIPLTFG
jgi:hypothetical protein